MRRAAWVVPVLCLLAACGGRDPAPAGPAARPVTVQKSGGFAGVRDEATVDTSGAWRRGTKQGTLTAADLDRLTRTAADSRLPAESTRTPVARCADGVDWTVTVGDTVVRWQQCDPAGAPPAANDVARLVFDLTN